MEKRLLGKSGIELSAIGFGCGDNARLMVEDDETLRLDTIRTALEQGIYYFDTAAAYGDGASERNLGIALGKLSADPAISDKVILFDDDLKDPRSAVLRCFDENLRRIGRDKVDALILHNRVFNALDPSIRSHGSPLTLDHIFSSNGVAAAFKELVDDKRVGTTGFTSLGGDYESIDEMLASGVFGAINVSLNFLNPSASVPVGPSFIGRDNKCIAERAAAFGIGVMAIQVLARGALTGTGPTSGHAQEVAKVALQFGSNISKVAIRYVLSKPSVSTVIVGLSHPQHVRDAAEAANEGPLEPAAVAAIEEIALGPGGGWDR